MELLYDMDGGAQDGEDPYFTHFLAEEAGTSPGAMFESKELRLNLDAAIGLLPPLYKTVVTLYHQEGLNYAEITAIMNMPAGTVKSYLFRARQLLLKHFVKKYYPEDL